MAEPAPPDGGAPLPVSAQAQALVDDLLPRCSFPAAGTSLDCAVSGGADSSALVVLATLAGCVVTVHHVDHGLRAESSSEVRHVEALATRFGARFVAYQADVDPGPNLEARARQARFSLMPNTVVTGHTMDDRAETVLINLLRGAGRTGLSPLRDPQRQPIIGLRRSETEAVCAAMGVEVVSDPSNMDPAFLRNRVRHELLPLMQDISRRDLVPVLDRQAELLGAEDDFLDALAAQIDATDAKAVASAPAVLARRALRAFITREWPLDHPPSWGAVDRALDVARGLATSCDLEGGHRVHRTAQSLRLVSSLDSVRVQ